MAKSAGAFIDALGLTKVDVLGFSIGSMIAQNLAVQRPDLLRKLVIVGSGPRIWKRHSADTRVAGDFHE
jgi:pimeloyl-ACP methyl ester carboxylesterase